MGGGWLMGWWVDEIRIFEISKKEKCSKVVRNQPPQVSVLPCGQNWHRQGPFMAGGADGRRSQQEEPGSSPGLRHSLMVALDPIRPQLPRLTAGLASSGNAIQSPQPPRGRPLLRGKRPWAHSGPQEPPPHWKP